MKTEKYEHLIRIVSLLKLLEISERTIPNIALVIEISERTVWRYLKIVQHAGFCVANNSRQEYTLVNNYGVPRLTLTALEIKALITTCTDYYSLISESPAPIIVSVLFKTVETKNKQIVPFLKEKLRMDEKKIIPSMFSSLNSEKNKG